MSITNGSLIQLYLNGLPIFSAKTNEETAKADMIETTNKFSGGNASYMYGKLSFSGSAEGLFAELPNNLLAYGEDVSNSVWTNSGLSVSGTKYAGYDSRILAQRVTSVANGDSFTQNLTLPATGYYTFSGYFKNAGAGTITIRIGDSGGSTDYQITMTSSWARYSVTKNLTGTSPYVKILSATGDTATQFDVCQLMLNTGQSAGTYEPSSIGYSALFGVIKNGTKKTGVTASYLSGSDTFSGDLYLSELKRTSSVEDAVTYSFTYQFTGSITQTTL